MVDLPAFFLVPDHRFEDQRLLVRQADADTTDYIRYYVAPSLQPLSDRAYLSQVSPIWTQPNPWSWVLDGETLYWIIQWGRGLLVIAMKNEEPLAFAQIVAADPEFGGRDADAEAVDLFERDEEAQQTADLQYGLVFTGWDAMLDPDAFDDVAVPATEGVTERHAEAMTRLNAMEASVAEQAESEEWFAAWIGNAAQSDLWNGGPPRG